MMRPFIIMSPLFLILLATTLPSAFSQVNASTPSNKPKAKPIPTSASPDVGASVLSDIIMKKKPAPKPSGISGMSDSSSSCASCFGANMDMRGSSDENMVRAEDQLPEYLKTHPMAAMLTSATGVPISDKTASVTAGPGGPVVLDDLNLVEELAFFDRERIPERVVHAKGAGAYGYFEVTNVGIKKYCKASVFSEMGKKTAIAIRFSIVTAENGAPDTIRDPRGFAIKFYTDEGNWDLVGNNTPIFFIRDPILFPSFIHSQRRNPRTHLRDPNMFWDFITLEPQTVHQIMITFSDAGIPDGYRYMDGFGSHTFKLVNDAGNAVYCKFHYTSNQGVKNMDVDMAAKMAGMDADYAIRDLYNAIASGKFPSWKFSVQIMTFKQAEKFKWNPFDLTKLWPLDEFPLMEVGKLVLNRNPDNYFAEVEQMAFCPAHFVPGIEASPDKMLQGRIFSYLDTQRYRLGPNFLQLPVNCPFKSTVNNNHRDGPMCFGDNQKGAPNYFPNSFNGQQLDRRGSLSKFPVSGDVARYNTQDEDNFSQPGDYWRKTLKDDERTRLVNNIVNHLINAQDFLQVRAVKMFSQVDSTMGKRIDDGLKKLKKSQKKSKGGEQF